MDYVATLSGLAAGLAPSLVPGGSPLEPTVRLQPPTDLVGPDGSLALGEVVQTVADVPVPLPIDLAFVGKFVRSPSTDVPPDPTAEDPIGGMPIVPQLVLATALNATLPPKELMVSDPGKELVPGVPEVVGRLKGTVTQTVRELTDVVKRYPVTAAVRWQVMDESTPGAAVPASNVRYIDNGVPKDMPNQLEIQGASGSTAPLGLSLKLPPLFTELTSGTPDVVTLSIHASVQLQVALPTGPALKTSWIPLPPIPLVVPTIPIPTLVILCENAHFQGRKVVLVPDNSLVGTAAADIPIATALDLTSSALGAMLPNSPLVAFLAGSAAGAEGLAATQVLKGAKPKYKDTIVAAHSRVDNLSTDEFLIDPGGLFGIGRLTGNDMASSIICLGRPQTVFDFFIEFNLNEYVTRLQIKLDDTCVCAIKSLAKNNPTPDVVYGGKLTSWSPDHPHEDRISSLSFAGPSVRFLPAQAAG
jgi:hypothetical protein